MKKYIETFKSFFQKKKPHVCEYKYKGCVSHFYQLSDIKQSIENPTWYHYPSMQIRTPDCIDNSEVESYNPFNLKSSRGTYDSDGNLSYDAG